jgi:hypothetical protein
MQYISGADQKGELALSGVLNFNPIETSIDAAGSYAFQDNLSLFLGGSMNASKNAMLLEAGLVNAGKLDSHFSYELLYSVRIGKYYSPEPVVQMYSDKIKTSILRPVIQPSVSYFRDPFELSISSRISGINYFKIRASNNYRNYYNMLFPMIEPAITASIKLGGIRIYSQFSLAIAELPFEYNRVNLVFGGQLNIKDLMGYFSNNQVKKSN